jgi:hypothetical protein
MCVFRFQLINTVRVTDFWTTALPSFLIFSSTFSCSQFIFRNFDWVIDCWKAKVGFSRLICPHWEQPRFSLDLLFKLLNLNHLPSWNYDFSSILRFFGRLLCRFIKWKRIWWWSSSKDRNASYDCYESTTFYLL